MTAEFAETIRRHCRPLEPNPTGLDPHVEPLAGIRAVLFDVYGTLLVSGIGEVGTEGTVDQSRAFADALAAVGIDAGECAHSGVQTLIDTIGEHRAMMIQQGIETPDVDILQVWRDVLSKLQDAGGLDVRPDDVDLRQLSVEYECRANPVWPMPSAIDSLQRIHNAGLRMGIISNAQFFTLPILSILFEATATELGFDTELEFLSFDRRWAKPGRRMYELARDALKKLGIAADETLYVGNDLLNDVTPASQAGFRTALFAGDKRSLRLRAGDERVRGIEPDRILTDLSQLTTCLGLEAD